MLALIYFMMYTVSRKEEVMNLIEKIISLITAIISLAAAIIAYKASKKEDK